MVQQTTRVSVFMSKVGKPCPSESVKAVNKMILVKVYKDNERVGSDELDLVASKLWKTPIRKGKLFQFVYPPNDTEENDYYEILFEGISPSRIKNKNGWEVIRAEVNEIFKLYSKEEEKPFLELIDHLERLNYEVRFEL